MAEFPCRTKTVSGTEYFVKMYDGAGDLRMTASNYESEEAAQRYIDRMRGRLGEKYKDWRFEIKSNSWTQEVCIECGNEVY